MKITKTNILLAEDSADDVLFFRRALKKCEIEHALHVVNNGQDAIGYLSGTGQYEDRKMFPFPTFCILDLKMPGLSGMDVLQWLSNHEECAVVPTLVLTSSALPEDIKQAYRLRANSYFTKPNNTQELCSLLSTILQYWKLAHIPAPPVDHKCR